MIKQNSSSSIKQNHLSTTRTDIWNTPDQKAYLVDVLNESVHSSLSHHYSCINAIKQKYLSYLCMVKQLFTRVLDDIKHLCKFLFASTRYIPDDEINIDDENVHQIYFD